MLNPSAVEAYGRSQLRRAKTDPTDAAVIALFDLRTPDEVTGFRTLVDKGYENRR